MLDWVKMSPGLYRHPKVCKIALHLENGELFTESSRVLGCDMAVTRNVTRNAAIGALVTLWGTLRHRGTQEGDDLVVNHISFEEVDEVCDLPGMAEAMATVDWLRKTTQGVVLPRFFAEEHNHRPVLSNAERQARFRERRRAQESVTKVTDVTLRSNGRREEKRREELGEESPNNPTCSEPPAASEQSDPIVFLFPVVGRKGRKGPTEWPLRQSKIAEYAGVYPGVDVLAESRKALQWCRDNPTKRKTPRGMPAFLNRWFEKSQNRGGPHMGPAPPAGRPHMTREQLERQAAEMRAAAEQAEQKPPSPEQLAAVRRLAARGIGQPKETT
jgi:hypothetical protein